MNGADFRHYGSLSYLSIGGTLRDSQEALDLFQNCHTKYTSMVDALMGLNNGDDPTVNQVMDIPQLLPRLQKLERSLSKVQELIEKRMVSIWSSCPRTQLLSTFQCYELNAVAFFPEKLDALLKICFPGIKSFVLENFTKENHAPKQGNENDDGSDSDDDTYFTAKRFQGNDKHINMLPPSVIFGLETDHAPTLHLATPVNLFDTKTGQAKPMVTWLTDLEKAMRKALMTCTSNMYEAFALYYSDSLVESTEEIFSWILFKAVTRWSIYVNT